MNQELQLATPQALAVQPTAGEMLQAIIKGGVTGADVVALEKMLGICERMQDRESLAKFSEAFADLQQHMPTIQAERSVPDKNGGIRFKYAPTEDIMRQLQPFLTQHRISVSFSQRLGDKTVTAICTVTHGGYSRSTEFTVRAGQGPYGGTERDADVAASTVAQREALCDAFNIVRRRDGDARLSGAPITSEQAEELARRVAETNSDKVLFLRLAGAPDFKSILSSKYEILDAQLAKKERAGK